MERLRRRSNRCGALIACEPVENSEPATTIHLKDGGERLVSDGPFAESKEQLGGLALLECANQDEALEWAHKVPMTRRDRGAADDGPVALGYESRTPTPARTSS